MPSIEPTSPKLSVGDILSYSDAELVQYMNQHRRANGGFDLELDGWENLPKEQRDQLAQRLKAGALLADEEMQSRPVDLDEVTARLRGVADHQDAFLPAASASPRSERSSTPLYDWDEDVKQSETRAYHELVKAGGRPLFPISALEEVLGDPEAHREILLPWQVRLDIDKLEGGVFCKQLWHWRGFRYSQQYNRGIYNKEEEFAAYYEKERREKAESKARWSRSRQQREEIAEKRFLDELRAKFKRLQEERGANKEEEAEFPAFVKEEKRRLLANGQWWSGMTEDEYRQKCRVCFNEDEHRRYREYFLYLREDNGRGGFPEYVAEAKRRLAKHGFTQTFQFDEDPARQDKLTTWIEYLNYECSWHDRYERLIERLGPVCDEAWKKLVDSGVLEPGDTYESVWAIESVFRRAAEKEQADKAVESAKAAARAALAESERAKVGRSRFTEEERKLRLATAHSQLVAAKEAVQWLNKRRNLIQVFIEATWDRPEAQRKLHQQSALLQWVLEQVPLVENELNEPEGESCAAHGGKSSRLHLDDQATDDGRPTKRRRDEPSELAVGPSKRLRKEGQDSTSHDAVEINEVSKDCLPQSVGASQPKAISQQLAAGKSTDADTKDLARNSAKVSCDEDVKGKRYEGQQSA